jgi:NAD(P)-dependent dehydrogenase (short-subunit alcohol dehydrogenase family)
VGIDVKTSEIESLLEKHQDRLAVIQGDVSDRATSERAVETALNRTGRLDVLILNAAILSPIGPAAATKVEEWKRLFDVNFFGLLHTVSDLSIFQPL